MRTVAALAASAALLGGCASSPTPPATATAPDPVVVEADEGWRWESYAGVQLQVPDSYGHGMAGSPLRPDWCAAASDGADDPAQAAVGRWYLPVFLAIGCPSERPTSTLAPSVDLGTDQDVGEVALGDGWVSETVEVAGVRVTVSDPDAIRRSRIVGSVAPVDGVDGNGCPTTTALVDPGARPEPVDLPSSPQVPVTVCRYALEADRESRLPSPLLSSSRLADADARALVAALAAAPQGAGPDEPDLCSVHVRLGEELAVVRLGGAGPMREVVVRYSGCDGRGTDDGVTPRRLTAAVLQDLLVGPHRSSWLQGEVSDLAPPP